MCGIAGAINFKLAYNSINAAMIHRGPDAQNGFCTRNVDLYHLRLSIMDIGGGAQPMSYANRYTIIFNGEIYNHAALRHKYALTGQTHSDTETLLMLYAKMGTAMLHELDGMFVMAIYDEQEHTVFIARDRAGKKPVYIYRDTEKIVFASELNCLKALLPLQMDHHNFHHYFRLGVFYRDATPYKNVQELPGGSFMKINCDSLVVEQNRWWDIHSYYLQDHKVDEHEALQQTELYLQQAVQRRIDASDLEVGSFLSGGIDSGLVTAIASRHTTKLKTFTVSFEGAYDEAPLAKLVADKYATDHHEIRISFNHLNQDIERIISNYGEPYFDSSAIPSYYVSEAAKKYVTVILNGDGADELFGGYRRYVPFAKYDFFNSNALVKGSAKLLRSLLPASQEKKSKYNYLYRLLSFATKSDLDIYLSAGLDIFEDFENNIIDNGEDYMKKIRHDFHHIAHAPMTGLKKIMNMDFDTNLFSDLLVKMDIATMAHSLEGRSPFLCKELLEYIPGLPNRYKINGGTTKYLLRNLGRKYLPETLIDQPKRGFEIPLKNWVNHELRDMIHNYLTTSGACYPQFIQSGFVMSLLNNKVKVPAEKRAKILWTIFCLEIWYRKVYQPA